MPETKPPTFAMTFLGPDAPKAQHLEGLRLEGFADPFGRSDKEWCQTFSGRQFWPLQPRAEEVHIEDIAHALAHQCRYTGHCRTFYSVAQHSVLVSRLAPAGENRLWGLMHDAAEAYLVDVARPVKRSPALAGYREAEKRLMAVICERFGLPVDEPAWVKHADGVLLATERRDLMAPPPRPWSPGPDPMTERIEPWAPAFAEARFLARFQELFEAQREAAGVCVKCGKPDPKGDYYGGLCSACDDVEPRVCVRCGAKEDEPAGRQVYTCKECGEDVCSECSENEGNDVACLPCVYLKADRHG